MDQRQCRYARARLCKHLLCRQFLDPACLKREQACDNLEIVFHPVVNFACQIDVGIECLLQLAVLFVDVLGHQVQPGTQLGNFCGRMFETLAISRKIAFSKAANDPSQIAKPTHDQAVCPQPNGQ